MKANKSLKIIAKNMLVFLFVVLSAACLFSLGGVAETAYAEGGLYYIVGEFSGGVTAEQYRMITENSEVFAFTYTGAATEFVISDGATIIDDNGQPYTLSAGKTTITFTEASGKVEQSLTEYSLKFGVLNVSLETTDGLTYNTNYTGSARSFTITDGTTVWDNGGDGFSMPAGETKVSFTPADGGVKFETRKLYFVTQANDFLANETAVFSTDNGLTYTYNYTGEGDTFKLTDKTTVIDNNGGGFTVPSGRSKISYNASWATQVVITPITYRVVLSENNLSKTVYLSSLDGVTYTAQFTTTGGSFKITDGENVWDNGGENVAIEVGRYNISFTPDKVGLAAVDNTKINYYLIGGFNGFVLDAESLMSTVNGVEYTHDYLGTAANAWVSDGTTVFGGSLGYALEAGESKNAFKPDEQDNKQFSVKKTEYFFMPTDDNKKDKTFSTVDGLLYTYSYDGEAKGFTITDGTKTWDNGGEGYSLEFGKSDIKFYPAAATGDEVEITLIESGIKRIIEVRLATAADFLAFALNCKNDTYGDDKRVLLIRDIDLTNYGDVMVAIFGGVFEGNFHTISGVKIEEAGSTIGLFRYVKEGGEINNLTINVNITPTGSEEKIGGLVGENSGVLNECAVYGNIDGILSVGGLVGRNTSVGVVKNCENYATVTGYYQTGGLVGVNRGLVENSANRGLVNVIDRGLNETIVFTGGVVGNNLGSIVGCNNYGQVGINQIGNYVGGIVGVQFGSVAGSGNHHSVIGVDYVGGVCGYYGRLPDEQIQQVSDVLTEYLSNIFNTKVEVPSIEQNGEVEPYIGFCFNNAAVKGKISVGGVTGEIGNYSLASYLLEVCFNEGLITVTEKDGGGLVGHMASGTVADSFNEGDVYGVNAEYVGGIVGNMLIGHVNNCFALGIVTGLNYVGGISGRGQNLTGCYAYDYIVCGGEASGAIAGLVDADALYNYFVSDGIYSSFGIDGINYFGKAQPVSVEQLAGRGELNQTLVGFNASSWQVSQDKVSFPALVRFYENSYSSVEKLFKEKMDYYSAYAFNVDFVDEDGGVTRVRVEYDTDLAEKDIPAAPQKQGYFVSWGQFEREHIKHNIVVNAEYTKGLTTISSGGKNALFLVEGLFHPDTEVVVVENSLVEPINVGEKYTVLKYYTVKLVLNGTELNNGGYTVRALIPDGAEKPEVAVYDKAGSAAIVESFIKGSYLVFTLNSNTEVLIVEATQTPIYLVWWFYVLIAAGLLAITSVVLACYVKKYKKKARAALSVRRIAVSAGKKAEYDDGDFSGEGAQAEKEPPLDFSAIINKEKEEAKQKAKSQAKAEAKAAARSDSKLKPSNKDNNPERETTKAQIKEEKAEIELKEKPVLEMAEKPQETEKAEAQQKSEKQENKVFKNEIKTVPRQRNKKG